MRSLSWKAFVVDTSGMAAARWVVLGAGLLLCGSVLITSFEPRDERILLIAAE